MSREIVKDILQKEISTFFATYPLSFHHQKVFKQMLRCQTEAMGFNVQSCPDCGYAHTHYNSCRNRNCLFCQSVEREMWIQKYTHLLINTSYFHIVFTVPNTLHPVFLQNQKLMYNILFQASSKAISTMAASDTYSFGKVSQTSILHTWGQTLSFHPHIHSLVSAGGLHNGQWVSSKKNYFMSVKAISKVFRGIFLELLSKKYTDLTFYKDASYLNNQTDFDNFISSLYSIEWVVYAKKPMTSPKQVLEYIGRYSHRIAISPARILHYDPIEHKVTFKYRDYKDHSKTKEMTLHALEFLRRFSMHILPSRFVKIRHYGIIANNARSSLLVQARKLTNTPEDMPLPTRLEIIKQLLGIEPGKCPKCGCETMVSLLQRKPLPLDSS